MTFPLPRDQWPPLPVTEVLDRVVEVLGTRRRLVLEAPPGAGKTTLVPLAVAAASWCTGRVLVLEVDGAFHLEVSAYTSDMRRQRRLTTAQRLVLRCSATELRHEPEQVMADLIALGVPRTRAA